MTAVSTPRSSLHWAKAHVYSMGIFVSASAVEFMCRFTDRLEGLISGLIQGALLSVPLGILFLPWSLSIVGLYRWTGWPRFRTPLIMMPAFLMSSGTIIGLGIEPPTASTCFETWAKVKLPTDARDLHYHYSGGGFADHTIIFHFHSSPAELKKSVSSMRLSSEGRLEPLHFDLMFKRLPLAPDLETWKDATTFTRSEGNRMYHMYINADQTEAYVYFFTI